MNGPKSASSLTRRLFLSLAGMAAVGHVRGQAPGEFPTRPIKLIVPFPPGGPSDRPARVLAEKLQAKLGQSVIVENRAGAGGTVAATQVLQASPDGYTLLLSQVAAQITAPLLLAKPPYDGVKDFAPIGGFGRFNAVLLVHAAVPVRSFRELVAYAKQHQGKLNYGSAGIGTMPHLQTELVRTRAGMDLLHVPYKGGAAMVQALVANEVQVLFGEVFTSLPFIRSGQVRPLAVATANRLALLPDVPTLGEEGLRDISVSGAWIGISGPRQLPAPIAKRLSEALAEVAQDAEVKQYFASSGGEAIYSSPESFQALWAADQKLWAEVIRANNIRSE